MPEKNGFIFFRQFAFVSVFGSKTQCNAGENPENSLRIKTGSGNLRHFSKQFRFLDKKIEKTQKNRNPFLKNPKSFHHKKTGLRISKNAKRNPVFFRLFPFKKNPIRSFFAFSKNGIRFLKNGIRNPFFEKRNPFFEKRNPFLKNAIRF